ncbi:MAG: type II toxin-antitoxin system VapC family toxin [Parvularculaceae bacterium]|nr:type II toxin-antitoxin system VapC family toxin [Parvularculaceae bacterium]
MRAIDTNVVIRFLTADNKREAALARAIFNAGDVYIPITVCLEAEWVLRSGYGFTPEQIAAGLRGLAGLPGVSVENPLQLAMAIDWMVDGMDFVDALHVAKAEGCSAFLTFDKKLVRAAKNRSATPVESV